VKNLLLIVLSAAALTASAARAGVELEPAFPALGFVSPVDLQNAGDGSNRLFVVEKRGVVYVFENQTGVAAKTVFLDIQSKVNDAGSEEGLLGLAFHPDYPDTPYFYVNYTASDPRRSVIERYAVTANPDSADATSEFTLLEVAQPFSNHNAGQLAFGPDGMLYIGLGDGGSGGDPSGNGQNLQTLLGSILRIDVDTTDAGLNYGIPPDNPYHGNAEGYREEIWAHGLRNPWRYSFDPPTGRLWLADVGQSQWEEINIIRKGLNYGWNVLEGSHCYSTTPCDSSGLELPVWEYAHPIGQQRSITGGYVYRGTEVPVLAGHYIYADYITGEIWRLFYDGINPAASYPVVDAPFRISSFGRDENGNLFVLQYASSGAIWRLVESATAVNGGSPPAPPGELGQNTPNPFNPATTIEFTLREHGFAEIYVYGVDGRPVDRLAGGPHGAGPHSVTWRPGGGLPSGVYFYLLRLNGEVVDTRRMVLLK
jgi:glucose/arabinose dehydrogenase